MIGDPRGAVIVGRAAAYGLCLSLTLIRGTLGTHLPVLALLLLLAVGASVATARRPVVWAPYVEAATAASLVAYLSPGDPIALQRKLMQQYDVHTRTSCTTCHR